MKKFFAFLLLGVMLSSCGAFQQLTQMANLRNCSFDLDKVDNVTVAGINVNNLSSFSAADLLKVAACIKAKKVPVEMNVKVGVDNPGTTDATVTRMQWVCTVDDQSLATGTVAEKFTVPASGSTTIPIKVNMNAYDIFSSSGVEAVKAFVNSFSKEDNTSSRVAVKVKPTVSLGGATVTFPNYITLLSNK